MELSVIICTHNPRPDYLKRTLNGLQAQRLPMARWELLLIDNASDAPLAGAYDFSWHPSGRCVREDEIGLTPARLRGIREARGDWLLFVDDDNVLAPDYLSQTLSIAQTHPHLGAFGAGALEPEFEIPPEREVAPLLPRLALRTVYSPRWTNHPSDHHCLPWGAGLAVSRQVAEGYGELLARLQIKSVLDRKGTQLFSGGDVVFSWAAAGLGQGFGIFPELKIVHLIGTRRVQRDYLIRLLEGSSYSESILVYLLLGDRPKRLTLRRFLGALPQFRRGRFQARMRWAELRGEAMAADFVVKNNLTPLGGDGDGVSEWESVQISSSRDHGRFESQNAPAAGARLDNVRQAS